MPMRRRITGIPHAPPKRPVTISVEVMTRYYPPELAHAIREALEKAGIEVKTIEVQFAKRAGE